MVEACRALSAAGKCGADEAKTYGDMMERGTQAYIKKLWNGRCFRSRDGLVARVEEKRWG